MLRFLAAIGSAAALAACGGGDDAPSEDEIRRAAARACATHSETVLLDQDLPKTRRQERRLDDHVLGLERALLTRLERIDDGGFLDAAVDARRAALEARRQGRVSLAAEAAMRRAFERRRIRWCGGFGAAALRGGLAWVRRITKPCARLADRAHDVRRYARGARARRPYAHVWVSQVLERFDDRTGYIVAAPGNALDLETEGERELSRAVLPLQSLTRALLAGDRRDARALRRQLRRSEIRGRAAWRLTGVPACARLADAIL